MVMTTTKRTFNHGDLKSRRRKALQRLGTENPKCVLCDVTDPFCLHLHHVAGQANDEWTVILCLNHHAMITNAQKDLPLQIGTPSHPANRLGQILLGIAELLFLIIAMLREAGVFLVELGRTSIWVPSP